MSRRAIIVVVAGAAVILAAGTILGLVIGTQIDDAPREAKPLTRERVDEAFSAEGIELERQFASRTGLVDATYTAAGVQPHESPLVVEILRTDAAARNREAYVVEHASELGGEITVLRTRNVVCVLMRRDANLHDQIRDAMTGLG